MMLTNRRIREELQALHHRLDLMDRTLVVNNPDSPMASDTFNGLVKQVARNVKATQMLEVGLAQLDQIAQATDDMSLVRSKIDELMGLAGVRRLTDGSISGAFQTVGEGTVAFVVKPAYVAGDGTSLVSQGVVEMREGAHELPATETIDTDSGSDPAPDDNGDEGSELMT